VAAMPPARVLSAIQRDLRLLLIAAPGPGDRLVARHPLIAETVVSKAPKQELAEAYKRVLAVLAHDMDPDARRGDGRRWFRLYKRLIHHDAIYHRFGRDIGEARAIYDSLTPLLARDADFWLQYGSLELLTDGDLDSAAVYLASAESLNPGAWWVQNAKGHLKLAQGRAAKTYDEAFRLRQEGEEILEVLMEAHGEESAYPCHTLIAHTMDWLDVWIMEKSKKREELERLRVLASEALEAHPTDQRLKAIRDRVERAYLSTAM
jgi:tetratricopeptide (TPR) repeat protein